MPRLEKPKDTQKMAIDMITVLYFIGYYSKGKGKVNCNTDGVRSLLLTIVTDNRSMSFGKIDDYIRRKVTLKTK